MKAQQRPLWAERLLHGASLLAVALPLILLAILLIAVGLDGIPRLDGSFLTSNPSRRAARAGIQPALVGSLCLVTLTALIAVPLGIASAIYLEEYGPERRSVSGGEGRWARLWKRLQRKLAGLVEVNIANLAGVPSIIYGLLGLGVFVRLLSMDRSLLAGAFTLAMLILPIVIMASREALRTVPMHLREASYGLGATRWQTVRGVVLPLALPGMMTGSILAISRAIGETAPLVVVGALTYITFLPDSVFSEFSALPIQIFNWVSRPQEAFVVNAAAGIIVLLVLMLAINAFAVLLRARLERRIG